ncbi:hypothetical protein GCM10022278_38560 [Allohahella marinimesophila]|uniref:Uncharacterized protein n=1 Tax=Allohahella marinimesophila TaxID=1054972 RepID=A0ABP7Q8D0_9GAMM
MLRHLEITEHVEQKKDKKPLLCVDNLQDQIVDYKPLTHDLKLAETIGAVKGQDARRQDESTEHEKGGV